MLSEAEIKQFLLDVFKKIPCDKEDFFYDEKHTLFYHLKEEYLNFDRFLIYKVKSTKFGDVNCEGCHKDHGLLEQYINIYPPVLDDNNFILGWLLCPKCILLYTSILDFIQKAYKYLVLEDDLEEELNLFIQKYK